MMLVASSSDAKTIRAEIQQIRKAGKKIRKTKESARAFLLKHGFITKENKLSSRYR